MSLSDNTVLLNQLKTILAGKAAGGGGSAASVIDKSVVNITSNVAEVGQYAFYGCERLKTASFPEASTICGGAFVGCINLLSISFPKVTEIKSDIKIYQSENLEEAM